MGSFVFKWEHPASEVYVTGTFDNWSKSEKLVKTGDIFIKDVTLPSANEKIYYKFVVDGNWVTDPTAPQANDASGYLNNVLTTDRIAKPSTTTAIPLESSKVPEVVKKSQEEAGFSPEASAIPEEVKEKSEVEKELLREVPEAPPTSEGTAEKGNR